MTGTSATRLLALATAWILVIIPVPDAISADSAAGPETFLENLELDNELPGWHFRTGAFHTDNIARNDEEPLDELVALAEFGANWHTVGRRFAAAFDGNIGYRTYTRNDFDNEARGNFLAVADYFIVPDTLDWYITNRLANAPIDPLGSTTPVNVQFVNVLETGPRMTLRPGGSNELSLSVARAGIRAEESPIDHTRDTAALGFLHDVDENMNFGIVADVRRFEFDEGTEAADFDQQEAHLTFDSRNETVNFSAAAGRSRFELPDTDAMEDTTGWLRLRARRTSSSTIYAALERTANDTATSMLLDEQLLQQGGVPGFVVTGDPFFSDLALVRYTRGWRAHEWFVAFNVRDFDYFSSPLDRRQRSARLGAQFAMSARLLLSLAAGRTSIDYRDLERTDKVNSLDAELDYRIGRNWSIVTGASRYERDSEDPSYAFKETMLSLFFSYSPQRSVIR